MSAAVYTPRGYAKAAVDHLKQQEPGTALTTAELAEAISCDARQSWALLEDAIRNGALQTAPDPADKRRRVWSLGDGVPLKREEEYLPLATPAAAPTLPRAPATPWPFAASTGTGPAPEPEPERNAAPAPTPQAAATKAKPEPPRLIERAARLRCALWSDGELQITRGSARFDLSAEETRQLVAYLDRLTDRNELQAAA